MNRRTYLAGGTAAAVGVLAGCLDNLRDLRDRTRGAPRGIETPSGFEEVERTDVEGTEITIYRGSGTAEAAQEDFHATALEDGWEPIGELGRPIPGVNGDHTGQWYERNGEYMHVQVVEVEGSVTVTVAHVSEEAITDPNDDAPADDPPTDVTPPDEVPGTDPPELARYPGSIRTGYFSWTDTYGETVWAYYTVDDDLDAVADFYEAELTGGDWTDFTTFVSGEGRWMSASRNGTYVWVVMEESWDYEGYVDIWVGVERRA